MWLITIENVDSSVRDDLMAFQSEKGKDWGIKLKLHLSVKLN